MKILRKLKQKFIDIKSHKIKKTTIVSIITNCIIAICVFSVFNMCFNVDAKVVSLSGYSAIYKGNTTTNNACLMINVYWGTEYIEPMLKILEENNIKTTFFVGGY